MLVGREPELAALGSRLRSAADGHGSALVIFGEAGIGKSALIERALREWPGASVLRSTGSEFEVELPYAALQQLWAGILDYRMKLPRAQRQVLEHLCGLGDPATGGAFLVGLASLGLLSQASGDCPVICVVDDAHWVDAASAQALAFIARRIEHERVALVFVLRDPSARPELADIDRLAVGRLDDAYAHVLLSCAFDGPVDGDVSERIVAEAQGNPLALLELPRSASPGELAGGYSGLASLSPSASVEESFRRQAAKLTPDARTVLCLAAAEPLGDPRLLRCAAQELGLGADAIGLAEVGGLITLAHRVRFRHPLARSAVYRGAEPPELRRVHAALAAVTDPVRDPDRKAWHQSLANVGTNEEVAVALEGSAGRAQDRGGLATAAAFLERAADLSADPARRARRALAAAEFRQLAGTPEAARGLLERACRGPLDAGSRGRAKLLRAMLAYQATQNSQATALLLDAARELEPDLARETYLRALNLARFVERRPGRLVALARRVGIEAPERNPPRAVDLMPARAPAVPIVAPRRGRRRT